jgi:hypothetical protein
MLDIMHTFQDLLRNIAFVMQTFFVIYFCTAFGRGKSLEQVNSD